MLLSVWTDWKCSNPNQQRKFQKAIIQIFTVTSGKEVGDSDANYEMMDREGDAVRSSLSLS